MRRETFIRLSGWGMIAGVLLMVLGFSTLFDASTVRRFLYDTIGGIDQAGIARVSAISEVVGMVPALTGVLLFTVGLIGLYLRYGDAVARWAKGVGWLTVLVGGPLAMAVVLGWLFGVPELSFTLFMVGITLMLLGLGLFGVAAVRSKAMPRGNWLPVTAGLTMAIPSIVTIFVDPTGGLTDFWDQLGKIVMVVTLVSLILLGYTLAESTEPQDIDAPRQATAV